MARLSENGTSKHVHRICVSDNANLLGFSFFDWRTINGISYLMLLIRLILCRCCYLEPPVWSQYSRIRDYMPHTTFDNHHKVLAFCMGKICWVRVPIQKHANQNDMKNRWSDALSIRLTHWSRVTHICVGFLTIIGSENGLWPGWHRSIIWTNAGMPSIGPLGTNFSEVSIEILAFLLRKCVWMCHLRNGGQFVSVN